jgi:hypothetical protein
LYRNAMNGVDVHGRNHLVENNEVWGTIQYHPNWKNPPSWVDADGMYFFGTGHIFRGNHIHDIHYGIPENINPHIDCFQTWGDSQSTHDIIFEQNICVNLDAQSTNEVGQGFMLADTSNILIRNNIIQAYRNINAVNSTNLTIVNNTFTGAISSTVDYDPSVISLTQSPNVTVKNNAFYDISGHIIYPEDSVSRHGSAYRSDGQPLWDAPYPHDLWGINPLFQNPAADDFHLRSNSPLIDAGIILAGVPTDFDGVQRPQGRGFDIGAFEYPFAQKRGFPNSAQINESVTFAISFLANDKTITVTDMLPIPFKYLSSNVNCEGSVVYNSTTRQIDYSGASLSGTLCTIEIVTQVNTSQRLAVTNTAIIDNSIARPLETSASVILNGINVFFPLIFKAY